MTAEPVPELRRRPRTRGPRRVLPPEEVAAIVRLVRDGQDKGLVAAQFGVSVRTVWRYLAQPEQPRVRRLREAIAAWSGDLLLTGNQVDRLARYLDEAMDGWT